MPWLARICTCRYSGRYQANYDTTTWVTSAVQAMPLSISRGSTFACTCVYRKPKSERSGDEVVCRGKARFLRGCKSLPARVAPAGSNRSRREGDDLSEASGGKGHLVTPR